MRSRRTFLLNCSALGIAAPFTPVTLAAGNKLRKVQLDEVTFADFAAQLNSVFAARGLRGSADLRLVSIDKPAINSGADAMNEKFALLFVGTAEQPLPQDTYSFEHGRLGVFTMFITPVGRRDPTHRYYEAVFNRPSARRRARSKAR